MSRSWRSIAQLDPSTPTGSKIQSILSTGDFDYLALRALQARETPSLNVTFDRTRYAAGRQNLVLQARFSDDVVWILRVPLVAPEDESVDMLSEITTMRLISQKTTIPVAKIFAWETTAGGFRFPYILMERLVGDTTQQGLVKTVPVAFRPKVAEQLANVLFQLSQLTFDKIGRLIASPVDDSITIVGSNWHPIRQPMKSSLEFFYGRRYSENMEVCNEHGDDPQWNTACWVLTSALVHVAIPGCIDGPFPLCHLDFWFANLMFDDEWNLTGVIDWTNAQTAPLEQLAVVIDLMPFITAADPEDVMKFRNLLVEALADLERDKPAATKISSFLASTGADIYACQYAGSTFRALTTAKQTAILVYQDKISWEQLVSVYGALSPPQASRPEET